VLSQSPGIGVTDVINPSFDRGVEFGKSDLTGAVFRPSCMKPAREFDDVVRLNAAMRRIYDKSQPGNAMRARNDLSRRFLIEAVELQKA